MMIVWILLAFALEGHKICSGNVTVDGRVMAGAIFDYGMWMSTWNAGSRDDQKDEVYFYLPKLESYEEALWWDQVFAWTENYFSLSRGTIKSIVLIENILAAFQMDEIIYHLKDHILGLNVGKWDYIFSFIKKFRHDNRFILPDRSEIGNDFPFLEAYTNLLIKTCRKRGCCCTGGMAPNIPTGLEATDRALYLKVLESKKRGAQIGLDGELVAHPTFVGAVREAFESTSPWTKEETRLGEEEMGSLLLRNRMGKVTLDGVAFDVRVVLFYIESWLRGEGGFVLDGSLEDLATSEISRSQLWYWIKHSVTTVEGTTVTLSMVLEIIVQLLESIRTSLGETEFLNRKFLLAQKIFVRLLDPEDFVGFMPDLMYPTLLLQDDV
eukprot:TRINITY_DN5366_c0_g2_i1.p1 TRINITY_DN5366_c0_g2~~TRINITY_DN5366_c0_g2_i1.p1  ORF type:complete len:381 (-),score=76.98 TRINITY_DN5366_c0_g2_i1:76-1218(-)